MEILKWLEEWYTKECDGNWEHSYGITITTIDNPGWQVQIDLRGTRYSDMRMEEVRQDNGDDDWLICSIKNGTFQGFGDGLKLGEIICIFQRCILQSGGGS